MQWSYWATTLVCCRHHLTACHLSLTLSLSVSRSTPAPQPSLKRSGWSHPLIGPYQQPGQNGALLAQLQSRANAQTNKQTNEDINKPHGSSLGTWSMVRSKDEADLQTQELIRRHVAVYCRKIRLLYAFLLFILTDFWWFCGEMRLFWSSLYF